MMLFSNRRWFSLQDDLPAYRTIVYCSLQRGLVTRWRHWCRKLIAH